MMEYVKVLNMIENKSHWQPFIPVPRAVVEDKRLKKAHCLFYCLCTIYE